MRLHKFLSESISKQQIKKAAQAISKRDNVDVKYLEYVGIADYTKQGFDIMIHFNNNDKKHPKYRSTVVINLKEV